MGFAEYGRYDAIGLAELVRAGDVTPTELLDEALARTATVNPALNAIIHLMEARARAAIAATRARNHHGIAGAALLSKRAKILEAFDAVLEAAPYTMIANVTGQPSMSLPLHMTADGLPMGVLFTGARVGDEAVLFQLAAQLERAAPWSGRIAPHAIP